MSRKRTHLLRALIILCLPGPALADDALLRVFAGCTGRLSAEMEHAWLMNDDRADALEAQRLQFVSILQAIMPQDQARETLNMRIDAKLAHSAMLTTAVFGTDPKLARMAKRQAMLRVQDCQNLLLDG